MLWHAQMLQTGNGEEMEPILSGTMCEKVGEAIEVGQKRD